MKRFFFVLFIGCVAASVSAAVVPRDYYGKIAKKAVATLAHDHVLHHPVDDELSARAWTNLVEQYDAAHCIFLQSDLDAFAAKRTRVDDELKAGDVSFGFAVYDVFTRRLAERVAYATNLLARGDFDFSVDESWDWDRKNAPWPTTRAEAEEVWRLRLKNEVLVQTLSRELDAEQAAADTNKTASAASTNETETVDGPALTPCENLIKRYRQYVQVMTEPDEETVLQRYLSSVMQACDPHSDYLSPMRKEDFDMDMNLSLCGVGAVLSMDDGALKIQEVMPGGPMDRDGRMKKGDRIVAVGQGDGPLEDILYKPMNKSIRKIRGPKGTVVTLEFIPRTDPTGATRKRASFVRDEIKLEAQAATGRVERVVSPAGVTNWFGYAKLPGFYGTMEKRPDDPSFRSCSLDVAQWVARFNTEETDGMVLDLRGNGGGSLREAVLLAQLFMTPGPVVQINDERGRIQVLATFSDLPCAAYRRPLIVLIDRLSASASEIVAGALQDTGRALVIGDERSHGKGTVQTVSGLGQEKYGSVKITTARFYRINGSSTQVKGVESDVHLPSVFETMELGEDKLPNALAWTQLPALPSEPVWNAPSFRDVLAARSAARCAESAEWKRHAATVERFRTASARKSAPLERTKRLAQMREEREMREIEERADGADDDPEEDEVERRIADAESGKTPAKDPVLDEAFRVLADWVELSGGAEMPVRRPSVPTWLRALGGE